MGGIGSDPPVQKLKVPNEYKGISWNKQKQKYVAKIWKNGNTICGGNFEDIVQTANRVTDELCDQYNLPRKNPIVGTWMDSDTAETDNCVKEDDQNTNTKT